jgi:hypothetical protein
MTTDSAIDKGANPNNGLDTIREASSCKQKRKNPLFPTGTAGFKQILGNVSLISFS